MQTTAGQIARQVSELKVLIVDDELSMRKVTRALLQAIGIREIHDANNGTGGLDLIRMHAPDIVILDWEMPSPNGPDFVRAVRSPGEFPFPDVPIIMLTGHSEHACVVEAMRLGINEYLLKPVSSTALLARIVSILRKPRPMVKQGDYYGPAPRKPAIHKPDFDADYKHVYLIN
jgi:two-component system, chemotaxis family, chemotaxis protein CheY